MPFRAEKTNKYGLSAEQLFEVQSIFHQFDANHNGYLTMDEVRQSLHSHGINANDAYIYQILSKMDYNHDGKVSYDEFMKYASRIYQGKKTINFF